MKCKKLFKNIIVKVNTITRRDNLNGFFVVTKT